MNIIKKSFYEEQDAWYAAAGIRKEKMRHTDSRWWQQTNVCMDRSVTGLDEFQSAADFQNDVAALVIKPLTCYLLSWLHTGLCLYELSLATVHLLTLNPDAAFEHGQACLESFLSIFFYKAAVYVEIIMQALSLTSRCVVTLSYGCYQTGVAISGLFAPASSSSAFDKKEEGLTNRSPLSVVV